MRIISKDKDYYDHCVSYFGYDETRIYDRRKLWHRNSSDQEVIAICGELYPVLYKNGKFYFDKSKELNYYENLFFNEKGLSTDLNSKFRQPVLISSGKYNFKTNKFDDLEYVVPVLKEWGFPSIISAEEMYMKIYDFMGWLKDNPGPPDNQTDKEKVSSHGFDPKTSFRPKMKV